MSRSLAIKIIYLVILLFLVGVVGYGSFYLMAKSRLPQTTGSLVIAGLKEKVEVLRDEFGIPHIFAANDEDLFKAYGFVIAQDRLFQMELHRRLASGRLAEVLGERVASYDELFRTLRLRRSQDELVKNHPDRIDKHMKKVIEDFTFGINAFIDTQKLPTEFLILGFTPEHFDLLDVLSFPGYMAFGFAEGFKGDLVMTELMKHLSKEKVSEIRRGYSSDDPTISKFFDFKNSHEDFLVSGDFLKTLEGVFEDFGFFQGSNSWALAPSRSKSGHAILANDPHMAYTKPTLWYEAHLKSPQYEVYGHFLSVIPFPVLGHTRDLAWGLTMSEVDDLDFYRETFNPKNSNQVLYKKQWVNVTEEHELIRIKGAADKKIVVRSTPHGPLVGSVVAELGGDNHDLSIKWQFLSPDNLAANSFFNMSRSHSVKEGMASLRYGAAPGLNVSFADKEGHIGWIAMGSVPIYPKGVSGDHVLDGASGLEEYEGYVPYEKHPQVYDPPSGVISTANNKPEKFPKFNYDGYWQPSDRAARIIDLLAQQEKWSAEELKNIQTDEVEKNGNEIKNLLISIVAKPVDKNLQELAEIVIKKLRPWKGESEVQSVGSAIYHEWIYQLTYFVFHDEMGDRLWSGFTQTADMWHSFKRILFDEKSLWWDRVTSLDSVETRQVIIQVSFEKMLQSLRDRLGYDVNNWKWGNIHKLGFHHPLGKLKPLDRIFDVPAKGVGGGYNQINQMAYLRANDSFDVTAGPSTRRIVDFANLDSTWGLNPLGQSGNLYSPHERDQMDLLVNNKYRRQLMSRDLVEQSPFEKLELVPSH